MPAPLRILIIEDSEDDATLVWLELQRGGLDAEWHRVETERDLQTALASFKPTVIICDYVLPQFTAPQALRVVQESGYDVPFIVVSGTVGEDSAVEMMKAGAHDYVMKMNLARLAAAVRRELHEAFIRAERNQAQAALLQTQRHLESAQEVARLGSWVYTLSGAEPMIWSKQTYSIFGLNTAEYDGNPETFFSFTHPADRSMASEMRQLTIRGEAPYALDHRIILRDGRIRWVHEEAIVERDRSGKPLRMVGVVMDITDRKEVEEQLRRSQARFARLAESGVIGILVGDLFGQIQDANEAILKMLGYTRAELLQNVRLSDLTPLEWSRMDDIALEQLKSTGSARPWEKEYRRKDGSRVPVLMGMAMLDASQHISFVLDITERKRLEEEQRKTFQLEEQSRRAQEASQFKSKFLANMSHELRTPLNAVIGFSELLEQELFGPLLPRQKEYIQNILASGHHLLTLVNDVLDISKVEAGRMELSREWTSLAAVVQSVERILQSLAHKKSVALELSFPKDLPFVFIDPVRMKQVLYNLLANGIKFTPAGGVVRLTVATQGNQLLLSVDDTGIGIQADQLSRLFQPFEQLHNASGSTEEGTGLGLALTKSLVELHGGAISVESEVGKGSSFRVSIPMRAVPATELAEIAAGTEELILLVGNDDRDAGMLTRHIRALGFGVAMATSPDTGLQRASELRPAAIILDLQMPRIDEWWAMVTRVKTSPAILGIPVIVFSVAPEPNRALYLGAMDYLVKPASREMLSQCLERIGIATHSLAGVRALVMSDSVPELETIASNLSHAGCVVHSAPRYEPGNAAHRAIDIIVVDGLYALKSEVRTAVPASVPILAIMHAADPECSARLSGLVAVHRVDALRLECLVRLVSELVSQREIDAMPSLKGLSPKPKLLAHIRSTISRAERESKRLAIVWMNVPLSRATGPIDWVDAVKSHLRPDDLIGLVGEDTIALVAYGVDESAAERLSGRLKDLLWSFGKLKPISARIVWYPNDGRRAEELLERCLPPKTDGGKTAAA